jgi:AcrR family transcriptional regulator
MLGRREQNRSDQRARIVESARRLFAQRSVEEVTMDEVAVDAGVARATVFNHFGSKHALVEAITEDVIAHYQAMLRNALADTTTPTPVLVRALFEQMAMGIEEDRRFYRGVFREIAKIRLGLDEGGLGEHAGRTALGLLVQLLTRGQQRGDLSRALPVEDLASAFDSLVNGTIMHWLYGDVAAVSLRERMQRAAEVFLGAAAVGPKVGRSAPRPRLAPRRPRRRT